MALHLIKLAVGADSIETVRSLQQRRAAEAPPLRHRTRNFPRRAADILAGGSLYWVIAGTLLARQRILDIRTAAREDGTRCADLVLDPALVAVPPRAVKPFQGWRYLTDQDAPPDLAENAGQGDTLPEGLRRDLAALSLL